ncbi:MAG: PilZ domain-containing protein [Thermoguttaceae bacterium]
MNSQPSSPAEHNNLSLLRSSIRFPPDKSETWVLVGDERNSATVVDESFGGMGLTLELADAANLQMGDRLIVLHCDCPTPCRVQWIQRDQETQYERSVTGRLRSNRLPAE